MYSAPNHPYSAMPVVLAMPTLPDRRCPACLACGNAQRPRSLLRHSLQKFLDSQPLAQLQSKRLGRGIGTGLGKTSGRGHKGQNARTGARAAALGWGSPFRANCALLCCKWATPGRCLCCLLLSGGGCAPCTKKKASLAPGSRDDARRPQPQGRVRGRADAAPEARPPPRLPQPVRTPPCMCHSELPILDCPYQAAEAQQGRKWSWVHSFQGRKLWWKTLVNRVLSVPAQIAVGAP